MLGFLQPNVPTGNNLAEQAEAAYSSGDFQEAITLYQSLLTEVQSGEIYFNLGSAYYQLGQNGYALVNYLRASDYMPRDDDLRINLAVVRSERVNPVVNEEGFWEDIARASQEGLTTTELALVIISFWWISCGLFALQYTKFKRNLLVRAALILSSSLFVIIVLLGIIRISVESLRPRAVIVEENVQAMSGPSASYLKLFVFYFADEVRIVQRENGWVRVQLPDLREGWILADQLEEV